MPHVRGDRRGTHWRGAGGNAGRDRAAHARQGFPHTSTRARRASCSSKPDRASSRPSPKAWLTARGGNSSVSVSRCSPDTPATEIGADFVSLGDRRIAARTILWAAGVAGSPLGKLLGTELDRAGRVRVRPDLSLASHPEVFVAGDLASIDQDGTPVPGVAQAAKQMGARVAQQYPRAHRWPRDHTIPLHRPWRARDHWPPFRDRATARIQILRLAGLVVLARAAHLFPDRIPQPDHRAHQLGVGLFHLFARSAHHSRQRRRERTPMAARKKTVQRNQF